MANKIPKGTVLTILLLYLMIQATFNSSLSLITANGQGVITDEEKQRLILEMVNRHRNDGGNAWPAEVILAMICQEGGQGAFHTSGNYFAYNNYVYGPWTEPDNTWASRKKPGYHFFSDGIMQVTPSSGYAGRSGYGYKRFYIHDGKRFGGYLNNQEGYEAGIDDGIAYLDANLRTYQGVINAIVHYNTGPNTIWIYKNGMGDPQYLRHIADKLSTCVPSIYGLSNQAWVNALREGQEIVDAMLARLPSGQSVSYYRPYQKGVDAQLEAISPFLKIPNSPTNLRAKVTSFNIIELSWQDKSNNEDGFKIYRDGTFISQVTKDQTTYTDTGLQPRTRYCYQVSAFNSVGESSLSNRACARTLEKPNNPPIANAGPDQTVLVGSTVQLDGSQSSDPDSDQLSFYWRVISYPRRSRPRISNLRIANPTLTGLTQPGDYILELRVDDGQGGRTTDQVKITATTDITPPALIQDFQASDNEDSKSTLTWTNPLDSDLFQVIVKRKLGSYPVNHDDGETRLTIDSARPGWAETFVDTGLTNGTTYFYAVFSRDKAGNWNDQVVEGKNADTGRPQVPQPIGERIVFASLRDGNWEIYIMNADGSNQINLTNNPAFDVDPAFSPDGSKIVFASNRGCGAGTVGLFIMNSDGTNVRRLTGTTTAPDGSEFCEPVVDRIPAFSPDGSKIIYRSSLVPGGPPTNQEIFLLDLNGTWPSNTINLTNHPANDNRPVFTPDGSKIVFSSDRDGTFGSGIYDIYIMNVDGTGVIRLTDDPADDDVPFVSPDGTKITFTSNRSGNYEIYVMNLDGSNVTNLTNNPADDGDSNWSSDGSKITFVSNRDGNFEVYIMNADGSNQMRLTNTSAMELEPRFQPRPVGPLVEWGEIIPSSLKLEAKALPSSGNIKFLVDSAPVNIRVDVFNLSGRLVFHTDWVENGFEWNLLNDRGQRLANGVYLYVITVRTLDGRVIRSKVQKLIILR